MITAIAIKNILHKPLNALLSLVLLTSAIAIMSLLILLERQFEENFNSNLEGVDMVLGAQGSPLQLVLSSIYQMDAPTGNISYDSAKVWMKHPFVKSAIPLAFGDNYRGYKIVGTTPEYLERFGGKISSGRIFKNDFEVVIGANIAEKLNLKPGDEFFGAHGGEEGGEVHEEHPYKVCGIATRSGKVSDNLILSNISTVWEMHHEHAGPHSDHDHPQEITSVLFQLKNKMAFVIWPRLIAQNTKMQLASPAVEINRLFTLFGVGISALRYLAYGIMLISGLSIFIALYNTLKERRYEFALLRISGAGRFQIFSLVVIESLVLCVLGFVLGTIVGRLALALISATTEQEFKMGFNSGSFVWEKEGLLLLFTIFTGIAAALIPAIKAYRLNISKTLANA